MTEKPSELPFGGYLEKNSGLIKNKSKLWCCLHGHLLQFAKENKRASGFDTINLGDVETVKKITSDKSGTQFEIVMRKTKKSTVFSAMSTEECREWIKRIQRAMMIGLQSTTQLSHSETEERSLKVSNLNTDDRKCLEPPQNVTASGDYTDLKSNLSVIDIADTSWQNSASEYASIDNDITTTSTRCKSTVTSRDDDSIVTSKEMDVYATVMKTVDPSKVDIADTTLNSLQAFSISKPPPLIPLREQDFLPLENLKTFLNDNKSLCRVSYSAMTSTDDSVQLLKSMLHDLNSMDNISL